MSVAIKISIKQLFAVLLEEKCNSLDRKCNRFTTCKLYVMDTEITSQYNSFLSARPEGNPLFDSDTSNKLKHFVWSLDGNWIYAERSGDNAGLVRFKPKATELDI